MPATKTKKAQPVTTADDFHAKRVAAAHKAWDTIRRKKAEAAKAAKPKKARAVKAK